MKWIDIHKDEIALLVGNGKSLNDVPEEFLKKYPSFGFNHIYLLPFQPTYFAVADGHSLAYHSELFYETASKAKLAFFNIQQRIAAEEGRYIGLQELYTLPNACLIDKHTIEFYGEAQWTGGTVAYVALKIAYMMGFGTILLVGCDRDKDCEYFSDDYPAQDKRLRPSKQKTQTEHFALADKIYKEAGRRIVNLSLPSVLDEHIERGRIEDWL